MYNQSVNRITMNPSVMGGKPCIRGHRVTVDMVVSALKTGTSPQDFLADFPYLEHADLMAAQEYVLHQQERL